MCLSENKKRISLSVYKASDISKKRRNILRAKRRHVQDVHIDILDFVKFHFFVI